MVQTDSVEAIFVEQYSITADPSCPIIQSPMVTSPMSSAMVTSPLLEVVVSAGDDTHIGNDDWIVGGINSDNLGFSQMKAEMKTIGWMRTIAVMMMKVKMRMMIKIFRLILMWENLNLVCMNLHNFLMI